MLNGYTGLKTSIFCLVSAITFFPQSSPAGIIDDLPDAIVCNVQMGDNPNLSGDLVFYLDARTVEGQVTYKSLGLPVLQIVVNSDGVITSEKPESCQGKTLDELEEEGRAVHLYNR